ncbi:MAG: DNA translocase FtsK [Chlamydiales bacterium]
MAKKTKSQESSQEADSDETVSVNLEIKGLLLVTSMIIIFLSLISFSHGASSTNAVGLVGNSLGWFFHIFFGITSYLVIAYGLYLGFRLVFQKPLEDSERHLNYFALMILSLTILLNVAEETFPTFKETLESIFYPQVSYKPGLYHLGGTPAYYLYRDMPNFNLKHIFNSIGVTIIFSSTLLMSLIYFSGKSLLDLLKFIRFVLISIGTFLKKCFLFSKKKSLPESFQKNTMSYPNQEAALWEPQDTIKTKAAYQQHERLIEIQPDQEFKITLASSVRTTEDHETITNGTQTGGTISSKKYPVSNKREEALKAQRVHNGDFTAYEFPPLKLMSDPKKVDQAALNSGLKQQAEILEETLASFGIEAKVGRINCGPTITSFEVHPAVGVKVQRILSLENDIALNMKAKSIRIIAPIPGKAAIGIEVPNPFPQEVSFKELMHYYQSQPKKFRIPVLLGKAVAGEYVMSDLAKMPHCIIAGATGSGKSVCINTLIMSILLTAKPDEVQLLMIDPKKVELTPYTNLPHMIAPVITEPHGAYTAMQWLVKEMELRYEILKQVGVRNIDAFNQRKINRDAEGASSLDIPERFPYIVGIVDELADLMMVASNDIETPIARIAQMARAVGIHLVLATQRPSREVITGLIKANFPTRIAFKVSSRINSQIILDAVGAESLLGNGDMLFLPPGSSQLIRAQGALVRDEDIHAIIEVICSQSPPRYRIASFDKMGSLEGFMGENGGGYKPSDDLYPTALDIVTGTGNASTTFLQRRLKIGYARAASLMDELEKQGIVSPAEGNKPRKVLQFDSVNGE